MRLLALLELEILAPFMLADSILSISIIKTASMRRDCYMEGWSSGAISMSDESGQHILVGYLVWDIF
ncbi:hypothetical protein P3X46_004645 [Hevea brasiliensis]|uniref:Uncharacterized protein n=1 Tax=Hevea brasiliensis TaxID=3981 RepID=A0ABQ9MXY8_HEVBR|nr:hypothetical protein P3X46_004645 [Hevea brasiliensis]